MFAAAVAWRREAPGPCSFQVENCDCSGTLWNHHQQIMSRDPYQTGEFNLLCDLYVATLRRVMAENDYQAAFNAKRQFLEEQRFRAPQEFQSDQGFRAK